MYKKRRLKLGQNVLIIHQTDLGYVQKLAVFSQYRKVPFSNVMHETPIFVVDDKEISGLDCFWVLPDELKTLSIEELQKSIIWTQIEVLRLAKKLGYEMPNKLKDKDIDRIVKETTPRLQEKIGFDPTDQTWIETELAITGREKNWFKFERTNDLSFLQLLRASSWNKIVDLYNQKFEDEIDIEQARALSLKRMRYIFGSTIIRLSGNALKEEWKKAAREFEENHRRIGERMIDWAEKHNNNFPRIKTRKEISFSPDPYFHECVEKIPQYFTSIQCNKIREGQILRVIAYDPQTGYLKLDFPKDIRRIIKGTEPNDIPIWISHGPDYVFFVNKSEVHECLEFLEEL